MDLALNLFERQTDFRFTGDYNRRLIIQMNTYFKGFFCYLLGCSSTRRNVF